MIIDVRKAVPAEAFNMLGIFSTDLIPFLRQLACDQVSGALSKVGLFLHLYLVHII